MEQHHEGTSQKEVFSDICVTSWPRCLFAQTFVTKLAEPTCSNNKEQIPKQ